MADVCSSDLAAPRRSRLCRSKLLVEPTDSLKILLAGFYSDRDGSSTTFATMLNGNTVGRSIPGSIILPGQSDPYVVAVNPLIHQYSRVKANGFSANEIGRASCSERVCQYV